MTKLNQHIMLADGRQLGYDEYGPSDGVPLFYFHGTPSSRKDWRTLGNEGLPEKLDVRVIAADRPGMGLSDFQPGRRIGDWPADVVALADALEMKRFAVFGYSGGGPYVLYMAGQWVRAGGGIPTGIGTGRSRKGDGCSGLSPSSSALVSGDSDSNEYIRLGSFH